MSLPKAATAAAAADSKPGKVNFSPLNRGWKGTFSKKATF